MPQKGHTVDQIVSKLLGTDAPLGKGQGQSAICMSLTCNFWGSTTIPSTAARERWTNCSAKVHRRTARQIKTEVNVARLKVSAELIAHLLTNANQAHKATFSNKGCNSDLLGETECGQVSLSYSTPWRGSHSYYSRSSHLLASLRQACTPRSPGTSLGSKLPSLFRVGRSSRLAKPSLISAFA